MAPDRPIVVLGAGINGAAIARELALSGAAVVVVDAADVASGSTAWSTRLIHGGLRYLEHGEIGLVRESLAERDRLVRLAPHLVRPLPFCLPLQRRLGGLRSAAARLLGLETLARRWRGPDGRGSIAVSIGLALYDLLATGSRWPRHRILGTGPADLPALDPARFPVVATYADAQLTWPERFTVELLVDGRRAAADQRIGDGSRFEVHTHARARLQPDGSLTIQPEAGGLHGAAHHDARPRTLRPAAIVNATGAWADRTLAGLFGPDPDAQPAGTPRRGHAPSPPGRRLIGGTKGSHLVLRSKPLREALRDQAVYAEAADGRPVFVLPFGPNLVLVGTTDIPFTGDPATARADDREIDYLLAATGRLFPAAAPTRAQIQQHYCGVRPLPATAGAGAPAAITRRHMLVRHPAAPLPTWSVVGGKLTTCRSLAEAAARQILPAIGLEVTGSSRARPLPGFFRPGDADHGADRGFAGAAEPRVPFMDRDDVLHRAAAAARAAGFGVADAAAAADALVTLFGSRGPDVLAPSAEAAAPRLIAGTALPLAAVGFCIREEWAATIEDIVERRLMLSLDPALSLATLNDVAGELARLGRLPADGAAPAAAACAAFLRERYDRRFADDR